MTDSGSDAWTGEEFSELIRQLREGHLPQHLATRDQMDRRGFLGETLLHYLAVEGFADGVRLLALHGASLDAKNKFGETALIDVALQGNLEMVELLLECGANPLIQSDSDGDTALHAAVNGRNPSVICRLRSIPGLASVRNHENLTAIELEEDLAKVRSPEHRS